MSMVKVKTAELTGAALDWSVAKAVGIECEVVRNFDGDIYLWRGNPVWSSFSPSTDWNHAAPLIAVEGNTNLIAACRAIVAAKLGDEVEVPQELVE